MKKHLFIVGVGVTILTACSKLEDPRQGTISSDIITLSTDNTSAKADGEDRIIVTAKLGEKSDPNKDVTFITEKGRFVGALDETPLQITKKASGKEAQVILIAPKEAFPKVNITAVVNGFSVINTVSFAKAYPDSITLGSEPFSIKPDGQAKAVINARFIGKGSDGLPVTFEAIPKNNKTLIEMDPIGYSRDGIATTTISSRTEIEDTINIFAKLNSKIYGPYQVYFKK